MCLVSYNFVDVLGSFRSKFKIGRECALFQRIVGIVTLVFFLLRYLVNFLLDSTIGLLLIYILLKAVSKVVACNSITPLFSGEYGIGCYIFYQLNSDQPTTGEPFQFRYWLAQCAVYLLVMLVEKICVGPLILFNFWSKVRQC